MQVKTCLHLTNYIPIHEPKIAISGQPTVPWKYPRSLKIFSTNLIQIKFHCYFCKVYKVTVTKQLKLFYLITIYEKYCNSKKVICDDIKILFSSVMYICLFFLLASWKRKSFLSYENQKNMGWCNTSWQLSVMTTVLFGENNNKGDPLCLRGPYHIWYYYYIL